MTKATSLLLPLSIATLLLAAPAQGQDDEAPTYGWSDVAELSYVVTGGNSETSTLSLRNTAVRKWEGATLTIDAGALRADTTTSSRFAVGSVDAFQIRDTSVTAVTAESYHLRGRYDRELSERLFWFAGAGWERNEPAGIQDRFSLVGGIGQVWFDHDRAHFRTDYGLTYTDQKDVFPNPATAGGFFGVRLGWDYLRKLGDATTYANVLTIDANADESSDYRADMTNSIAVSMSDRLALKVSLQLLYDNQPSLGPAPLVAADGTPTGLSVLAPLDDLDTYFTAALVVNF